jgi:1,4-dihydroxy-2-naphthoyl-CoA hydrolase
LKALELTKEELLQAPKRFVHARTVRFHEIDAAGIVFYPRFQEWFHDAYVELLGSEGCSLVEVLATRAWAAPLKGARAEFLKPLRFGDPLEVCCVAGRVERNHLLVGYRVESKGVAAAVGQTEHVFVDVEKFQRIELPAVIRKVATRLGVD